MDKLLRLLSNLFRKEPEVVDSIKNIDIIKEHEGLRLRAYKPTKHDVWTIGYGHTKGVKEGMSINQQQAEQYLREDIQWVEEALNKNVKVPLTQNQYDALGSLVFNIGEHAFKGSTVLRELNRGNYESAGKAFLMWNKQRNKTTGKLEELPGLTKRRKKEQELWSKN